MIKIDIDDNTTVSSAGKYDAEVITGANIKIEKGFIIPPVKKSKMPNCIVSNSKNKKAFKLLMVLFFLSSRYEYKFSATENKIIMSASKKGISILII